MSWLIALLLLVAIAAAYFVWGRRPRGVGSDPEVVVDKSGFTYRDGAQMRHATWPQLGVVAIRTTDEGPWAEDVYLVLQDCDEKPLLVVPQQAKGFTEAISALMSLPGFDEQSVISAMGCTSNHWFECWKGAVPGDPRKPSEEQENVKESL